MLLIRPLTFADLQGLERLAVISGGRMTTLPANRDHLNELINRTRQSLRKEVTQYSDESYHFVLEDQTNGEIVGVCGIDASVGINTPFYSYRVDEVVHASSELQIHNRIPALHLCQDYTGSARLCTLFLDKDHRTKENLNLLSRSRMLFMAQHPERFANKLIAELQGVADSANRSPFWECLGRHFFNMDFTKANYLTGINSKGFIADLMPHYPVYVPLLSDEAQASLGQPRPDMIDVKNLLEEEGFNYRRYVDIFDAGPTLEARTQDIRTMTQSKKCTINIGSGSSSEKQVNVLISNTERENFRCLIVKLDPQQPEIAAEVASLLHLNNGDNIRIISL
ncbi:arginine N-succinyltransferase [Neptunomonas japonica]|uniref:Arginine N-succinyltransferase n=1 Tax=Neptunomonas japonica JAMM 1380 TaxID=1441457 RepID=A0A7R6PQH8_9GAMM|nr:arginine N-succinyltransferase [Neptunomonas japonica]BBB30747.1 arginine N-succinyltransferase [Neptunomonas japonica JAMM 1380]